jgi:hypothetical protein
MALKPLVSGGGHSIYGGLEGAVSSFVINSVQAHNELADQQLTTEVLESVGTDIDFDLKNDETAMQQNSRYGTHGGALQHQ